MALPAVAPTTEQDDAQAAVAVLVGRAAGLHRASGASGASLLECFAGVADPRSERGVRHSLPTILGLCTAAVLCGCVTLVEITDWVTHADPQLLGALGVRRDHSGRYTPPHPDTIERVFAALGAQGLADQLGAYLGRQAGLGPVAAPVAGPALLPALAIDGKAVKGAIGADGQIPYLLAAATHSDSAVIAERLIGAKTNEVPEFAPLLRGLVSHRSGDTGLGRREIRTIQVTDAPADLGFPHAAQAFLIERYTTRKARKRIKNSRRYKTVQVKTAVAVLGITSLSTRDAAPEHLATYVRGHWSIEVRHEVALCE
ncbi:MAG: transposase [Actinobacteria bacterium]|nr:transposase [Actinomycetota bacterium]